MTEPRTYDGPDLSPAEFELARAYLYELTGIALGDNKSDMVYSRLAKRLRARACRSFADYVAVARDDDAERQEFVNCLTTNKTDFFREAHHFDYLRDVLIPQIRSTGRRRVRVWSAGCSTGEEPYTIAMTLRDACPASEGWDVRVLASDIDTAVLAKAERGVYDADRTGDVPPEMLHKHFLRGKGANAGTVVVRPEVRDLIAFRQINLIADKWPVRTTFDVIFCRNVVIYFDRETQRKLLTRFAAHLAPDGHLFLGHSENIFWMGDAFSPVGGTVYRPRGTIDTPVPSAGSKPVLAPAAPRATAQPKAPPQADAPPEQTIVLGDVLATRGPATIKTLLGSCVAACLYDPETGVGGMNHFCLPGGGDEGANARYGAYAMELLITAIMKKGGDRSRLRAKVFGGGKVLRMESEHLNVGAQNAEFVLRFLNVEGIPIVAQSLGGDRGQIVKFQPHTGRALAKPLNGPELPPVVARERDFGAELTRRVATPNDDSVTLF